MRRFWIAVLCLVAWQAWGQASADPFAPIRFYDGGWTVTIHDGGKTNVDHLLNQCSLVGQYYVCQQTVNGKVASLVIFVSVGPGHYFVQGVLPEGWATGRTELTIDGAHWVYQGKDEENGKTVWNRTTNDFSGPGKIHFESSTSPDGKSWTVARSGDEVHEQ